MMKQDVYTDKGINEYQMRISYHTC